MRPILVAVTTPALDHDLRIDAVLEPLQAQALVAKLPDEGLVRAAPPKLLSDQMSLSTVFHPGCSLRCGRCRGFDTT